MGVQLLDNEVLVPRIVAAQVRINALAAVLAVLLGNAIGGVIGMFLALPTLAILKTIFDRVESLQPWGRVLGPLAALPAPAAPAPTLAAVASDDGQQPTPSGVNAPSPAAADRSR